MNKSALPPVSFKKHPSKIMHAPQLWKACAFGFEGMQFMDGTLNDFHSYLLRKGNTATVRILQEG